LSVAEDVYRPAAIKQLETLAGEVGLSTLSQAICRRSQLNHCKAQFDYAKKSPKEF